MQPTGKIRKIVLGTNPVQGLSFVVGNEVRRGTGKIVSSIIEELNNYHKFGVVRYWVYYKDNGSDKEYVWKSFVNIPVLIEYDEESRDEQLV
jgi:hypothetical protein